LYDVVKTLLSIHGNYNALSAYISLSLNFYHSSVTRTIYVPNTFIVKMNEKLAVYVKINQAIFCVFLIQFKVIRIGNKLHVKHIRHVPGTSINDSPRNVQYMRS
jgi:hypothetical protein